MSTTPETATATFLIDGADVELPWTPALLDDVNLDAVEPVRAFTSFPGHRHWSGRRHCRRIDAHVGHESLTESRALLVIDSDVSVAHIKSQPMRITFGDGTIHVPDYLVMHADGQGTVLDVRQRDLLESAADAFDRTRDVCESIGLVYAVIDDLPLTVRRNLDLAWAGAVVLMESTHRLEIELLATHAGTSGITVEELEDLVAAEFARRPDTASPIVMGLIHLGVVRPELLDQPLEPATILVSEPASTSRWNDVRHPAHGWSRSRVPVEVEPELLPLADLHLSNIPENHLQLARQTCKILMRTCNQPGDWWIEAGERIADLRTFTYRTDHKPLDRKTLENLRRRCARKGWTALVDRRAIKPKAPPSLRWPEFTAALEAVYLQMGSTVSGKLICQRAVDRLLATEGEAAPSLVPCRRLQYRLLASLRALQSTGGSDSAKARRSARASNAAPSEWDASRFGEAIQIDATPLNFMVTTDDGTTMYRPLLVAAIDVASRLPVAARLIETNERTVDLLAILTDMADSVGNDDSKHHLPPLPPSVGLRDVTVRIDHDGFPYVITSDGEAFRAFPAVRPEHVIIDRGAAEKSRALTSALDQLRISVTHAPPGNGAKKPHVERFFGSLSSLFEEHKIGYIGRRSEERHPHATKLAEYRIQEINEEIIQAILHYSRQDAEYPGQLGQPYFEARRDLMAQTLVEVFGRKPFHISAASMIDLLPSQNQTIGRRGITIAYRRYDSNDPRIRRIKGAGVEVTIARHDDLISQVWVADPATREWIPLEWSHAHLLDGQPMTRRQARGYRALFERMEGADPLVRDAAIREFTQAIAAPPSNRKAARANNHRGRPAVAPVVPQPSTEASDPAHLKSRLTTIAMEADSEIA